MTFTEALLGALARIGILTVVTIAGYVVLVTVVAVAMDWWRKR